MDTTNSDHLPDVLTSSEDFDKEYKTLRCCTCTTVKQFTNDNDGDFFCTACKHGKCRSCTEYDYDNHSILGDEYEVDEEGVELWRVHDDEADKAIALAKGKDLPVFDIVELGTNNINYINVAFDNKDLKIRVNNISNELKYLIAFESLKPDPRVIRATWSHSEKKFTYRCNPANLKPFMLDAFQKVLRTRALKSLFKKAPHLGLDAYPWFRYDTDTLYIRYERCGNREVDFEEYRDAMKSAAQHIRAHVAAGHPPIARLRLSWCQFQQDPRAILCFFRRIAGIESIDLEAHEHYRGALESEMTNSFNRWTKHPADMQHMVNRGVLEGYPFLVRLFSGVWDGNEEFVFGVEPEDDPWADPDEESDEENESEEENDSEAGSETKEDDEQ